MFAVLVCSTGLWSTAFGSQWSGIILNVIIKLGSGIPHKIKFFVVPLGPISIPESLEGLVVTAPYGGGFSHLERLMLDILSKRWQTLDLISMMEELKRSAYESVSWEKVIIIDKLSSRPRFKKEEDLTGCA